MKMINLPKAFYSQKVMLYGIYFSLLVAGTNCRKFVQIAAPTSQVAASTAFSNNNSAAAAMTGIYGKMMSNATTTLSSGTGSISLCQGLAADELINYNTGFASLGQFYKNALSSSSGGSTNYYYWRELYASIYAANSVIEGLQNTTQVSDSIKRQLIGEAKFMRAFFHFYAVNLYGPVPIVTTIDYQENNIAKRAPISQVYSQIIRDLEDAQTDLPATFVNGLGVKTLERTRPNKGAATALLARAFLYTQQWDSAEVEASQVINNSALYSLVGDLNKVFLANSMEAIWQLEPVQSGYNTFDGYYFILTSRPGSSTHPVALSPYLLNYFESGDQRFAKWVGVYTANGINYNYPIKYKIGTYKVGQPVTEYTMVLRLAEQYLIRAEARAEQGDFAGAQADLNVIRSRAGLSATNANDQVSLAGAVQHERQVELFTEWGHRWFDLIRMSAVDSVMGTPGRNVCQTKGGSWNADWELMPIPFEESVVNPNLTQNPGYN